MEPPLHENPLPPLRERLADFFVNFAETQGVTFFMLCCRAVEGTKVATRRADVGIIDVPVDQVGRLGAVFFKGFGTGQFSKRQKIGFLGQAQGLR